MQASASEDYLIHALKIESKAARVKELLNLFLNRRRTRTFRL